MGGEQVDEAVAACTALLRSATDLDWTVTAGPLDWNCRDTAVHIAEDLLGYASQLAARVRTGYVPFGMVVEEGTDQAGLVDVVEATGRLFSAAVVTTPADVRAAHGFPYGSADASGFAAMGVAEVLLHTHDIAQGLGLDWEPPAGLAAALLGRIFPHVQPAPDPIRTLLWATGRGTLPGRAPVTSWAWHNAIALPTERLQLRELSPVAAADLAVGGPGGLRWLGGEPGEGTRTIGGLISQHYARGTHHPEWGSFIAVRRSDGLAVGTVGFHGRIDSEGRAEVGYDLVAPARGHGYATEALRALCAWGLSRPDAKHLTARVNPANTASQRVLERAGFTLVDHHSGEGTDDGTALLLYELRG